MRVSLRGPLLVGSRVRAPVGGSGREGVGRWGDGKWTHRRPRVLATSGLPRPEIFSVADFDCRVRLIYLVKTSK